MRKRLIGFIGSTWGQRLTILLAVIVVMALLEPKFFRMSNIYSILLAIAIYGILCCGMLFVILIGGIDLSIGSAAAMAGCIMTKTYMDSGYSAAGFVQGFLLAMLFCALLGLFHGVEITVFRMPAFVMTLATKYALYGAMQVYTGGMRIQPHGALGTVYHFLGNGRPLGIPMPVVLMVLTVVVCTVILGFTPYGRRVYAVGGNPRASELVGIRSRRYTIIGYVVCSMLAGFGGIVLASLNMSVDQTSASGYEGTVLMAMLIGGINIFGGEGGVPGAIFGALFVGIIDNMLILLDVPSEYQKFVQGVIIIVAIAVNMQAYRRVMGLTAPRRRKGDRTNEVSTPL
ncbi:MAG: ABC transporter permease [Clostridiales Family XIII bacterium]|jgi:ribose/xylose/arabinose/galactoside ABC-type transport system permease subunit|nr:ABC transporter permease [Clostridiales Family XIII bacterium]